MNFLKQLLNIPDAITGLVDEIFTSDEEKLEFTLRMAEVKLQHEALLAEADTEFVKARAAVIVAEAQSDSWLTRTWRPIMMLSFGVLIFMIGFGWADPEKLAQVPDRLWTLITVGIGGYIFGRDLVKVKREETRQRLGASDS